MYKEKKEIKEGECEVDSGDDVGEQGFEGKGG